MKKKKTIEKIIQNFPLKKILVLHWLFGGLVDPDLPLHGLFVENI